MDLFQPIEKIRFGDYVMTEAKQLVSLCTENHLTISSCESLTAAYLRVRLLQFLGQVLF